MTGDKANRVVPLGKEDNWAATGWLIGADQGDVMWGEMDEIIARQWIKTEFFSNK